MDLLDLGGELGVTPGPRGRPPASPRVVPTGGDLQDPAHRGDGMVGLLLLHEAIHPYGVAPASLAKKAAAFFRISRSCSSTRTRRRSWATSVRSSVVRPSSRRPSSKSAWRTQWLRDSNETPRSRATPVIVFPFWRASRTASALNSGGYGGLVF